MKYTNKTFCYNNLVLLKMLPDKCIDLIYCDILYGSGKSAGDYHDLKTDRTLVRNFYVPRINEMRRVLTNTGSIYLQMDWRIIHWIRCIMDKIFGYNNFKNEIIWHYGLGGLGGTKSFKRKHDNDTFLFQIRQIYLQSH